MATYVKSLNNRNRLPRAAAAAALSIGDVVYINTDGAWAKADANAAGLHPALGVVTRGVTAAMITAGILPEVASVVEIDGFADLTMGGVVYLSETAGGITQTAPTDAGDAVQVLGYAASATRVMFNVIPHEDVVPAG